ncbi:type II toxin-antitoxin system RelE/ParE family toxin [Palleronia caenipelagi]|uniref:Type II toxin-antitoxin system RelE/ParE family toxin n=1 Tax=Palleronia caenipelagi TaxID=2489174 RepID=A0A547PT16_9RHOB|nr:type II toxin-antitoxin system RelE/ParE family toxin [Palleronia caenipelagi]TRD17275.1 type II toxin-antitoxin system RelE/ParE family toxin [Palleronia caenipelagi]
MAFRVVRSTACDDDLEAIFDHLFLTYQDFGDSPSEAFDRAADRLRKVETTMEALGTAAFQGERHDDILSGMRHVTKDRAIFYFTLTEALEELRVLAVFYGGQDHHSHVLARIRTGRV